MHMIFIGFPKLKTTFLWSGTMQTSQIDIEDDFKMDCDAYRAIKTFFSVFIVLFLFLSSLSSSMQLTVFFNIYCKFMYK